VSAPDLRFSAQEIGLEEFGWNVPLGALLPVLKAQAETMGVVFVADELSAADLNETSVSIATRNGTRVDAVYAVAADGRNSLLRKAAGIHAREWSFDQSALITRFSHSRSHEHVSTEWHKRGGVFTTVPLPGNRSALVWMDKPENLARFAQMELASLAREIQLQNHGALGLVTDVTAPHVFPMRGVKADQFAAKRVYLVGEAAHVFPPIGAQGLNMSLRDAGHMIDVVMVHDDPGSATAMQEYDAKRRADVGPRQAAISAMNHTLLAEMDLPHVARAAGLAAVAWLQPLRELAMREGLSPSQGLPFAMR
jgi:2-octaprenyl-6-methoxyphenol hydroxylase